MRPFRFGLLLEKGGAPVSPTQRRCARRLRSGGRRSTAENLASQRGWEATPEDVLAMPTVLIGSVDQIADDLHYRRERHAISYIVLRDDQFADVAPVVRRLAGT